MKYLNKYNIIREGILDKHFEIGDSIITQIKNQNPIIDDIYDIMLDIMDVSNIIVPSYAINVGSGEIGINTKDWWEYFDMSEQDFDNLQGDYIDIINFIDNLRDNKIGNINIRCEYQFSNASNGFKALEITDNIKSVFNDVESRLVSIGCNVKYEYSGLNVKALWKIDITTPIKIKIINNLSVLDGISDVNIKDFRKFIMDYKIDNNGESEISSIIRKIKNDR